MEGRDKCEIKLTKPLKFLTGRKDCISDDPEGRGYVTTKDEVRPIIIILTDSELLFFCIEPAKTI